MKKTLLTIITFLLLSIKVFCQPTVFVDQTFTVSPITGPISAPISKVAIQTDGKILAVGDFTTSNGISQFGITRLNADGTNDATFNTGTGFKGFSSNSLVKSVLIQPDGKILACGSFTSCNGTTSKYIIRLNTNGSIDPTFNIGTGFNNIVSTMALQPNGQIIVGGNFSSFNGVACKQVIRLNTNGSQDLTYIIPTITGVIASLAIQPNGKVIIGGGFSKGIARLLTNGTMDNTFNTNIGTGLALTTSYYAQSIVVQSDGKIIIGGGFTSFNGTSANNLLRIDSTGVFNSAYTTSSPVFDIELLNNGSILFGGGNWTTSASTFGRLTSSFINDTNFNVGTGFNNMVFDLSVQGDGKIIAGGIFSIFNGTVGPKITRLTGLKLTSGTTQLCQGASFAYSYTIGYMNFNIGNIFSIILSDPTGNFASYTVLGSLSSVNNGTITATVPSTTIPSQNYKIALVSSNPFTVGNQMAVTNVTINDFSAPPLSISGSTLMCPTSSVPLAVSGGSLATYNATWHWYSGNAGGTSIGTGSNVVVSPTTTTTYFVRAEGGCNTTSSASLVVNYATPSTFNGTALCTPYNACDDTVTTTLYTFGTLVVGSLSQFNWYTNGCGQSPRLLTNAQTVTTTTTFYGRVEGPCGDTTQCKSVTVNVYQKPTVIPVASSTLICLGSNLTLSGTGTATSYSWSSGVVDNVAFTPTTSSTYTVTGDDGLCSNTNTISIVVSPCTSIDDIILSQGDVTLYPNPIKDILKVSGNNMKKISITNNIGQSVKTIDVNNQIEININLEDISPGIYFVNITDESKNVSVKKIIKE